MLQIYGLSYQVGCWYNTWRY